MKKIKLGIFLFRFKTRMRPFTGRRRWREGAWLSMRGRMIWGRPDTQRGRRGGGSPAAPSTRRPLMLRCFYEELFFFRIFWYVCKKTVAVTPHARRSLMLRCFYKELLFFWIFWYVCKKTVAVAPYARRPLMLTVCRHL